MSIAAPITFADRLMDLGGIDPARVVMVPAPGTATETDLVNRIESDAGLYELVDQTLVVKAMGWRESVLAAVLLRWLGNYVEQHDLGEVSGADGFTRLFADAVRAADVAFVSWARMPGGQFPNDPVPTLVPDFAIEVLSQGNTYAEMSRKRREYFHAGVRLLWMVDPDSRTITVYTDAIHFKCFQVGQPLTGGDVLPGWSIDMERLFARLDRGGNPM